MSHNTGEKPFVYDHGIRRCRGTAKAPKQRMFIAMTATRNYSPTCGYPGSSSPVFALFRCLRSIQYEYILLAKLPSCVQRKTPVLRCDMMPVMRSLDPALPYSTHLTHILHLVATKVESTGGVQTEEIVFRPSVKENLTIELHGEWRMAYWC